MGHYNHLALQFDRNIFGIGAYRNVSYMIPQERSQPVPAMGMLVKLHGSNLSFVEVGGEFAHELEDEGIDGSIDFALGELREMFGRSVNRNVIKGNATQWGSNPRFEGSYAAAKPGGYK
ncbi:MAG: hypothetical protein ACI90G_001741 [Urechidicola sp.]|jgi:hypothetical protein